MKAVIQERYGSFRDLRVDEVPEPEVGESDVQVAVRAASLHPDVWHVVTGRPFVLRLMEAGLWRPKNPIPGTDMAGVVTAVGSDVERFRVGDEVFGETVEAHSWVNGGAFAERVAVPEHLIALKPGNVTFEQAASVPSSGFIALLNLPDASELGPGRRVLVNGAGGGVGSLALQILKSHGTHVTAVDCTSKLDMLHDLGADRVIDYTREDPTGGDGRYDLVFDVPGNRPYSAWRPVLGEGGRYVLIGHEHYGRFGKRLFGLLPLFFSLMVRARFDPRLGSGRSSVPTKEETMAALSDLLTDGKLTPVIDRVYAFDEIHEAFRHLVEDELVGKVMLRP